MRLPLWGRVDSADVIALAPGLLSIALWIYYRKVALNG